MAPSTALLVLLLGVTLIRAARWQSTRWATLFAAIALVLSGVQLSLFVAGSPPVLDNVLVPSPAPFGDHLTGRMSPWTALGLVLASASLLLVSLSLRFIGPTRRHRAMDNAGVLLASVVTLLGVVVLLGYLFDAPLLYGSPVVPMALSSALALSCLGVAVLGLAPRDGDLVRPFVGAAPRATLLRAFLPIVPAMVGFELLLARIDGLNRGVNAALAAIAAAFLVASIVGYASHGAGLALAQADERFAKIFRSGLVAFSIAERKSGRIIDVNARWAALFGFQREEVIGRTVFELGLWDDSASRETFIAGLSSSGTQAHTEAAFRRKSGDVFHALAAVEVVTITGNSEPLLMTALIDLTERKRLEAQLLQAQKMEAVGRLAGGVAHDFNNALAVIQGYTEVLLAGAFDDDQRSSLGEIQQATTRAAGLTRQLLSFSRKEVADPRAVELNSLLANLEKMLKPLLGEDIDLAIFPGADLGVVKADPGQLEQAVINLCVNARQAMPKGGHLRIETANVDASRVDSCATGVAPQAAVAPGRYVMVAVSDTGCGIAREILPRIFEPFFTTKAKGVGTGLGLSMAYGSITQAGGHVRVESEVGSGTTVRIYLPCIDGCAEVEELQVAAAPAKGSETILVVEDEASLRALVGRLLRQDGYRVIEAGSGREALQKAVATAEEIHLVISDVDMPGMNGRDFVEALSAVRPGLRVIFVSGYTDDILASHGVLEPGTVLLSKPFTKAALLRNVHEVLKRPPAVADPAAALN
ncbi:MAG: ATP-binding protein [Thermoanaerobaculia bacterium]